MGNLMIFQVQFAWKMYLWL